MSSINDRVQERRARNAAENPSVPAESTPSSIHDKPVAQPKSSVSVESGPAQSIVSPNDWRTMTWEQASQANPNLNRSTYINGVEKFRKENGQAPMSYSELLGVLQNKDPYISVAEEQKKERSLKAAERFNAIGNMMANILNVARTQNGNPAMTINPTEAGEARIQKLRDYQLQIARNNFANYYNAVRADKAAKAAADAAELEYERNMSLLNAKQNSLLERMKAKNAELQGNLITARTDLAKANAERVRLQNQYIDKEKKAGIAERNSVAAKNYASAQRTKTGGSGRKRTYPKMTIKGKKGSSRVYDLNKDTDVAKMYNQFEKLLKIPPEERPKSIQGMREYILGNTDRYQPVENNVPYALGWGDENPLDW